MQSTSGSSKIKWENNITGNISMAVVDEYVLSVHIGNIDNSLHQKITYHLMYHNVPYEDCLIETDFINVSMYDHAIKYGNLLNLGKDMVETALDLHKELMDD